MAERNPLLADRRAYRQIGYAPSDGFPIAGAIAAATEAAGRSMAQNAEMQARLLTPGPAAAPRSSTVLDAIGQLFPSTRASFNATKAAVSDKLAKGETAQAVGRGAAGSVVGLPVAVAQDVVGPWLAADNALNDAIINFGRGALGLGDLRSDDAIITPAAAPASASAPVRQAAKAAGVAPAAPLSPQEALAQIITGALQGGASFNEIKGLGELIPVATKPVASNKDRIAGTTAAVADTIYQAALGAAEKLPAGEERDNAIQKATAEYYQRYASLAGVNLQQMALAERLREAEGQ